MKSYLVLKRKGQYEDAMIEIGDLWHDKCDLPDTNGLSPFLAAEFILRCGSIFGFLGHSKQTSKSQEKSRDLLTHARNIFLEIHNVEKIAECENYLSLTYSRKGEMSEAESWLEEAFSHNLPLSSPNRIYSYLLKSLLLLSTEKHEQIFKLILPIKDVVDNCSDNCLKGIFYNHLGNAWENTGNIPNALKSLEIAKDFYKKINHRVYYPAILNDLAFLYKTKKDFDAAHRTIDTATNLFKKIQDRTREGFSLDTKALIYKFEGKHKEALKTIEKALKILKSGENAAYSVEAYATKTQILISMDNISPAIFCLLEAVQIAKTEINEERAEQLVRQFENSIREKMSGSDNFSSENTREILPTPATQDFMFDGIELVLPSPLSNFQDIHGIWINNTHLENIGLLKNSLAVVVPSDEIRRGDLVAIEEIENQNVSCGFYDKEFGIVCLEGENGDPMLFDEEKIEILGKIVGVGIERTIDGKLIVETLAL